MRLPKISLKKCFILTTGFAIVVIFGFSLREKDVWKGTREHSVNGNGNNNDRDDLFFKSNSIDSVPDADATQSNLPKNEKFHITSTTRNIVNEYVDDDYQTLKDAQSMVDNYDVLSSASSKPWYFTGGRRWPKPAKKSRKTRKRVAKMFPSEDPWSDRITNQLMFVPPNYDKIRESGKYKQILLFNGLGPWNIKQGRDVFKNLKCPVNTCKVTANRDHASRADLILYKDYYIPTDVARPPKQLYMLYFLECPYHTQLIKFPNVFNWTSTYRRDSTIVAPYEKWEYYDPRIKQMEQDRNYALNKTKKVAWFVSNCGARNGRLQFAHDLQKYIQVDIYGSCGTYKCSRSTADRCFDILDRDYKFYLAFENSNCMDYITEKFFVNALGRNILPIVMGARPEDYESSAPYRSYIHVDEFASPKELADYLNILDKNDELYNSYFKWKGTGEFLNTYFWCRVCAMLHDENALAHPQWFDDVNEWWRGPGVCTNGSWRNFQARKSVMSDDD